MKGRIIEKGASKKLQQLAREEMKQKLLNDILMDMNICKVEGRDVGEYINDLKQMLDEIITKNKL